MTFKLFWKIVGAGLMAIITAIGGIFVPVAEPEVCMIGHRGYSGRYHENTELAFTEAVKHGSGGCETDVRITKDGVYVLSHNSTVVLKDGTELSVADSTYDELTAQPLKPKKGLFKENYLCTYERYLEIMKENDMVCFIELKGEFTDAQIKEIFDIADEIYDLQKCILQSFSFENLVKARQICPDLPMMLTYGTDDTGYERCFDYGFSIDADYNAITEEMVEEFHSRGLEVGLWTANNFFALSYCKSLGVDYIESDKF